LRAALSRFFAAPGRLQGFRRAAATVVYVSDSVSQLLTAMHSH
jgi:hypothetical protein